MFHKRHQRVNRISWRENLRLANALDGFKAGLSVTSQKACDRFVQRALLHRRPQDEELLWETWRVMYPESQDRELIEAAAKAVETAHAREAATVFAYKLSEYYYMFLERFVDAVRVLEDAIARTPGDARLFFALATIYNILGRPGANQTVRVSPPHGTTVAVATPAIEASRSSLGLTAQDALRLAGNHFSQLLSMNVHPGERRLIEQSLRAVEEMLSEAQPVKRSHEA